MKKNRIWTTRELNRGAIVSGVGFALYLAARALQWELIAGILCIVFALIAIYVFLAAAEARQADKAAVSYNLLWGTGALALMLGACAVMTVKLKLGL